MDKTCETCRWWHGNRDEWTGLKTCRRYPSIAMASHPRGGGVPVWAQTQAYHFCGEHQPKDHPHG